MDNIQLKKYLHSQKEPLDIAVKKKLTYLKSDEFLVDPFADWKLPKLNSGEHSNDWNLEEAFYSISLQNCTTSEIRQPTEQNQSSHQESTTKATMSMAERIALLRGSSMSVVQGMKTFRK